MADKEKQPTIRYSIGKEVIEQILNYLLQRPYGEVAVLMQKIYKDIKPDQIEEAD